MAKQHQLQYNTTTIVIQQKLNINTTAITIQHNNTDEVIVGDKTTLPFAELKDHEK